MSQGMCRKRKLWSARGRQELEKLALEGLHLLEKQIDLLDQEMADLLRPHQDQVQRLACRRVRKKEREMFSRDLNGIFYAPNESTARTAFFALKDRWARLFPSAVQIIEKDLDSLLTFFQFDPTY